MNYPDNIEEIKKFAKRINLDVKYLLGEKYEEDLYLSYVCYLPDNIVFNVGGCLFLNSVETLPENIVFNVGERLELIGVKSLPTNTFFNVNKIFFPYDHKVKVIWK